MPGKNPMSARNQVLLYIVTSYTIAIALDAVAYLGLEILRNPMTSTAWSFARMWSPTIAAITCLYLARRRVRDFIKSVLVFDTRVLKWYLVSPLIVYIALGLYLAIAVPLKLFDFDLYVDTIRRALISQGFSEEVAQKLAIAQAYVSTTISWYTAAITINTLFALGEEIGWRGYLFNLLRSKPLAVSTVAIGLVWGYWHTPIILLLGHNYQVNRALGGLLLFPVLTVVITYIQLEIVRRSGSVIPAASFHGAFNALWGLTLVSRLPNEARELYLGLGVLGIAVWVLVCLIAYCALRAVGKENRGGRISSPPITPFY